MPNYITASDIEAYIKSYLTTAFTFNDPIREINVSRVQDTTFLFSFELVTLSDQVSSKHSFVIKFDTITTYQVYHSKSGFFNNVYRGTGDIAVDFTLTNVLTIPAGTFGGVITVDDIVQFDIVRDVSLSVLDRVIEDAEAAIDSYGMDLGTILYQDENLPLFGAILAAVPADVKLATMQYTVSFLIERKLLPLKGDDLDIDFSKMLGYLKNSALKKIKQVGGRRSKKFVEAVPRVDPNNTDDDHLETLYGISRKYCDYRTKNVW